MPFRRLLAAPVFTVFSVLSIALSLGVTTAIYAAVLSVFWATPSVKSPDTLALVTRQAAGAGAEFRSAMSRSDFDTLRSRVGAGADLAAAGLALTTLDSGDAAVPFAVTPVTGKFFSVVGVPMFAGRGIGDADDTAVSAPAVVLSYPFWQSKLGADRAIVGRTVRLAGSQFTVVGIASNSLHSGRDLFGQFRWVGGDGWIAMAKEAAVTDDIAKRVSELRLTIVARLASQQSVDAFAAEMRSIGGEAAWSATSATAIARDQSSATGRAGPMIMLLVSLVFLIACTNVAALTHARGRTRRPEMAVRVALGASRLRLFVDLCAESAVLAVVGWVGALLVAVGVLRLLTVDLPLQNFRTVSLQPSLAPESIAVSALLLAAAFLIFGVGPALFHTRASFAARLTGPSTNVATMRWKGRRWLIVWQIGASTTLALLAIAATRAVGAEANHDPGFDLHRIAVGVVNLSSQRQGAPDVQTAIAALEDAIATQTDFESVALANGLPMGTGVRVRRIARLTTTGDTNGTPAVTIAATSQIFKTLGVPIVGGRAFDQHDMDAGSPVAVLSEAAALRLFGTADAMGRTLNYQAQSSDIVQALEVIGVVRDTDTLEPYDRQIGAVYVPLSLDHPRSVVLVGRTDDPAASLSSLARIARQAGPDVSVEFASAGPAALAPSSVLLGVIALVANGLSALAIALTMLGLYGVLSDLVTRRVREIGVRLALGAAPSNVWRMIVAEGLWPVGVGVFSGFAAGIGARIVARATPAGRTVASLDLVTFVIAAAVFLAVGFLACAIPARRAAGVDPNSALRDI